MTPASHKCNDSGKYATSRSLPSASWLALDLRAFLCCQKQLARADETWRAGSPTVSLGSKPASQPATQRSQGALALEDTLAEYRM